jgi:hypothetical protein
MPRTDKVVDGYYKTAYWKRRRLAQLRAQPLCESTSTLWGVPLIFNVKAMAASRWLGLIGRSRPTWTAPAACIDGRVSLTDERG